MVLAAELDRVGCLDTTEAVLQRVFRYQPPRWLPEGSGISVA
ncbi:MAG TPA: hypothetical protein VGF81_09585 [Solirubrobacteraceae bacterium]